MSEYIDVPGTVPPQKVVNSGRPVTAITNPDGSTSLVGPDGFPVHLGRKIVSKIPSPSIGKTLALSDVTIVSGAPTVTLETGPN